MKRCDECGERDDDLVACPCDTCGDELCRMCWIIRADTQQIDALWKTLGYPGG